ncbi:hypothetical protein [Flavobacterium anhuiense]|uniref:hypothetical protein n=1 Tax=Flavobacterium anhuiense TaxID=459526 RepID=UPI0020269B7D|nr:hypothetical protein [Flavobacterium anhuiense]URM37160.1 hypothetical protein LLY39_00785 [Flavobacterium anhuiense]
MKKHIFVTISIFSLFLIAIPITFFLVQFGHNKISNDITVWASFADYIGGTVNVILSLCSLVILGLLTSTVSKQSNEENKKVNMLIKRMDSYEKLTDFLPYLNQVFNELAVEIDDITYELSNENPNYETMAKSFSEKTVFFAELHSFLFTFGLRYGHLYNYDFNSNEYNSFVNDLVPTNEYFSKISHQIKRKTPGFPTLDKESTIRFLKQYAIILSKLKTELR